MDTENILANLSQQLQHWWGPITTFAVLIGLFMFISGLIFFVKDKNMGGQYQGKAIGATLAGLLLLNVTRFIDVFSVSLFESNYNEAKSDFMSYTSDSVSNPSEVYLNFALALIMIVGLIAFIKGVWLIKEASNNPQMSYGTAITHIVGGTIAVNIKTFINLLASTLGGSAGEAINNIMGNVGNI